MIALYDIIDSSKLRLTARLQLDDTSAETVKRERSPQVKPMKKLLASALCVALSMMVAPINLIAAGRALAQAGAISGVASVDGKPLANVTVRLRNVDTGQLVGDTTANAQGQFSFSGLGPGNFVVETVSANGTILGTSTAIALTAAAMVAAGVTVGTSAAALAAAGGVAAAGVGAGAGIGAAAGGGLLGMSGTALALTGIATTLVVTGTVVALNDASPSQ